MEAALFQCNACDKTYQHKRSLLRHRAAHHREATNVLPVPRNRCADCGVNFFSTLALRRHQVKDHQHAKLQCNISGCAKAYMYQQGLDEHRRTCHGPDVGKEIGCDMCCNVFMSTGALKEHKRAFHGGQLYICDTCGRNFKWRSSLSAHSYTHQNKL